MKLTNTQFGDHSSRHRMPIQRKCAAVPTPINDYTRNSSTMLANSNVTSTWLDAECWLADRNFGMSIVYDYTSHAEPAFNISAANWMICEFSDQRLTINKKLRIHLFHSYAVCQCGCWWYVEDMTKWFMRGYRLSSHAAFLWRGSSRIPEWK